MLLKELLERVNILEIKGDKEKNINEVIYDSRKVTPGSMFVAISGLKVDAHSFISEAIKKGAVAVMGEKLAEVPDGVTYILVPNSREALAQVAVNFYQYPSDDLKMVGVTGTNGKTTITHLVEAILEEAGKKVGVIGTISNRIGSEVLPADNTTPLPLELQELLSLMVNRQVDAVAMEVSSHALDLGRVIGCEFDVAIFTNLTQDHLDFHGTMENYLMAKSKLFSSLTNSGRKKTPKYAIINIDDVAGEEILSLTKVESYTYGINKNAKIKANNVKMSAAGVTFEVVTPSGEITLSLRTPGLFSVYNALAAVGAGLALGESLDTIKRALEKVPGVPGRFELVDEGQEFGVVVDYAHTPDSLENILETAKDFVRGRIITVFGCGGDRDRTKRPIMGEVAAKLSDYCIVTSDNPRSEDPERILLDVEQGVKRQMASDQYVLKVDRREAIMTAIQMAQKDDFIIIAGKGHETYQIIGDQTIEFDDRKVAREVLRRR